MLSQRTLSTFRRTKQRAWRSECRITAPGDGTWVENPDGSWTPNEGTTVYEGACLVVPADRNQRQVEVGGEAVTLHLYDFEVPPHTGVKEGHAVTVTASSNPGLVDRTLIVRDVPHSEWQVNRPFTAEEVRGGV